MASYESQQHKLLARLPMREVLSMTIVQQLLDKVKKDVSNLKTDPSARQGFKDTSENWHFRAWNREHNSKTPAPHSEVIQLLEPMINQTSKQAINRFHATRPLTANMTGEVVTMLLDLSVRHQAGEELYQALGRLQGNAVFQLVGIQYPKRRIEAHSIGTSVDGAALILRRGFGNHGNHFYANPTITAYIWTFLHVGFTWHQALGIAGSGIKLMIEGHPVLHLFAHEA